MKHSSLPLILAVMALGSTLATPAFAAPDTENPGAATPQATPGATFTPSRFRGVVVRRAPQAAPQRAAAGTRPRRGLVIRNERRAADPRDGVIADIDPASFPKTGAKVAAKTVSKVVSKGAKKAALQP